METQTEGIWVKTFRVTNPRLPSYRIVLLDVEGMGGIKRGMDTRKAEEILKKYYFVAMALSSVFCVHSEIRIQSGDV